LDDSKKWQARCGGKTNDEKGTKRAKVTETGRSSTNAGTTGEGNRKVEGIGGLENAMMLRE